MKSKHALRRLATVLALATAGLATMVAPANAAPPVPSGVVYRIVNGYSNYCLGARSFTPGRTLVVDTCDNPTNEILRRWIPQNLDGDATYRISLWAVSHCLAIGGARTDAGAKAIQWNCAGSAEFQWRFVPNQDGFQLINVNSNLCLDWGAIVPGAEALQYPCNGGNAQRWRFVPL